MPSFLVTGAVVASKFIGKYEAPPYTAARELIRALQADMRADLARVEDVEEEP